MFWISFPVSYFFLYLLFYWVIGFYSSWLIELLYVLGSLTLLCDVCYIACHLSFDCLWCMFFNFLLWINKSSKEQCKNRLITLSIQQLVTVATFVLLCVWTCECMWVGTYRHEHTNAWACACKHKVHPVGLFKPKSFSKGPPKRTFSYTSIPLLPPRKLTMIL